MMMLSYYLKLPYNTTILPTRGENLVPNRVRNVNVKAYVKIYGT